MRLGFAILLAVFATIAFGQKDQMMDLKWKVGKEEKLNYVTIMSDIDTSTVKIDFSSFSRFFSDSTFNGLTKAKGFFKKMNQLSKKLSTTTTLSSNKDGIVDIVMTSQLKENLEETDSMDSKETKALKMMHSVNQGIRLRGSVYTSGAIHSFWVKSRQKNLIALFFQLPVSPVKIGDKWSLDINLIANDQNFECNDAYKINEVTLTDIKKVNGESIAVLKYNIEEYTSGNFNSPSFFDKKGGIKKTMMKFSYQGIAEFSIDKGYWLTYDGVMSLVASGLATVNKKTIFKLRKE